MRRRDFLITPAAALAPAGTTVPDVAMAGDVVPGAAMVWGRSRGPARMIVTWRTSERGEPRRVAGPHCLETTDYTGRVEIGGLPAGQTILYEVRFQGLTSERALGEAVRGSFRTPPAEGGAVSFLWSGDLVGQGWGINPGLGGMRIFETMLRRRPDFFLHSGDVIYADNPILPEVRLPDGTTWRNVVTPEKSKVAESLEEYRGNYRYNLLDEHFRRFISSVAQVWQWDDHEVTNNWSPGLDLSRNAAYRQKNVPLLVAWGTKAFLEYAPLRPAAGDCERIYRKIPFGPLLDVFVLDMRSYRGPNTANRQETEGPDTSYLGPEQRRWLERELAASRAVWKAVASDMPIGLRVPDYPDARGGARWENCANGDGPALGRELEIARLLSSIKRNGVRNVVWFTADVHYTAAHHYDPRRARFRDFLPFWEFVSGPLNAGTFGPGATDDTFGIEVAYQKAPPKGMSNLPPSAGMQFFGEVRIDGGSRKMTVTLRDLTGASLFEKSLAAE